MKFIFSLSVLSALFSCAHSQNETISIPKGSTTKMPNESVATFGEGCFWHAEIVFQSLKGVRDAVSGYAGGTDTHPTYNKVCSGNTGHAEVVQVYYDSTVVSYTELVRAFFASMDPTELNRQGNDEGTQYRSIAFYRNLNQKQIIETEIISLTKSRKYESKKIVTQVLPFTSFFAAENYHQEYIINHPDNPYVANVSIPDYKEFRKSFKGNFK